MTRILLSLVLAATLAPGARARELDVVATLPDLADIAKEIGGPEVEVETIARGTENVHAVHVRPSILIDTNRADLFVQMGLALEHAWVPGLLETAGNPRIRPGGDGFVDCSVGWEPIGVPETLSRRAGADIHPFGNPHYNLHPEGGRQMADRILEGFVRVDPAGRAGYEARHAAYVERLEQAERRWTELAERWTSREVVTYHLDFDYLAAARGLEVVAVIEPKPGVPPTASHLAKVIERMRAEEVPVVLTAKWSNGRQVREIAERTGATVLELPTMVGGTARATSWIAMMDELHERLTEVLAGEG